MTMTSKAAARSAMYPIDPLSERGFGRWFFTGMAILMLATSIGGFAPAILNPAGRRAPLSTLGAVHGIVFSVWLMLFLVQVLLVESRRVAWHRQHLAGTARAPFWHRYSSSRRPAPAGT